MFARVQWQEKVLEEEEEEEEEREVIQVFVPAKQVGNWFEFVFVFKQSMGTICPS